MNVTSKRFLAPNSNFVYKTLSREQAVTLRNPELFLSHQTGSTIPAFQTERKMAIVDQLSWPTEECAGTLLGVLGLSPVR